MKKRILIALFLLLAPCVLMLGAAAGEEIPLAEGECPFCRHPMTLKTTAGEWYRPASAAEDGQQQCRLVDNTLLCPHCTFSYSCAYLDVRISAPAPQGEEPAGFYDPETGSVWDAAEGQWYRRLAQADAPCGQMPWSAPEGGSCAACGGETELIDAAGPWGTADFTPCAARNPHYNDCRQERSLLQTVRCTQCGQGQSQLIRETRDVCQAFHHDAAPPEGLMVLKGVR